MAAHGASRFGLADFNGDGIHRLGVEGSTVGHARRAGAVRQCRWHNQLPQTYDAGPNPGPIAVGDVNGDGWTDMIVVNSNSSSMPTLTVLFNDGNW